MYRMSRSTLVEHPDRLGDALGWEFENCVEMTARGHHLVAFVESASHADRNRVDWLPAPAVALVGVVLVGGGSAKRLLLAASEFAGYCPRAILTSAGEVPPEVLALAAMVDVGVIVKGAAPQVLCPAGTRVPGSIFSESEWELLDEVDRALASSSAGVASGSPA